MIFFEVENSCSLPLRELAKAEPLIKEECGAHRQRWRIAGGDQTALTDEARCSEARLRARDKVIKYL